jgi:Big-like domain-containing protein
LFQCDRYPTTFLGDLKLALNLMFLGSFPNTCRETCNPGASHEIPTLLEIPVKYFLFTALLIIAVVFVGCGAGHPRLTSIAVSPASATASSSLQGEVGFTAMGTFSDHGRRELSLADGLSWKSLNTVVATIDDTGQATCVSPGPVTITATAPADLQITVSNGVQNTSPKVSGTATLNCT